MAEPTDEQKLTAAMAALDAIGVKDAAEARSAVAVFWSQMALLQLEAGPPYLPALLVPLLKSTDPDVQKRIEALNMEAAELAQLAMQESKT